MEKVSLDRFRLEGLLGSGSDYEVYAACDTETGHPVVVKRPKPDYIDRGLHTGIDLLSEALIDIHASVANSTPGVCRMLGYTDVGGHGRWFEDETQSEYRALVFERARGHTLGSGYRGQIQGGAHRAGTEPVRTAPRPREDGGGSGLGAGPAPGCRGVLRLRGASSPGYAPAEHLLRPCRRQDLRHRRGYRTHARGGFPGAGELGRSGAGHPQLLRRGVPVLRVSGACATRPGGAMASPTECVLRRTSASMWTG